VADTGGIVLSEWRIHDAIYSLLGGRQDLDLRGGGHLMAKFFEILLKQPALATITITKVL
jgi:hypothetical protein